MKRAFLLLISIVLYSCDHPIGVEWASFITFYNNSPISIYVIADFTPSKMSISDNTTDAIISPYSKGSLDVYMEEWEDRIDKFVFFYCFDFSADDYKAIKKFKNNVLSSELICRIKCDKKQIKQLRNGKKKLSLPLKGDYEVLCNPDYAELLGILASSASDVGYYLNLP